MTSYKLNKLTNGANYGEMGLIRLYFEPVPEELFGSGLLVGFTTAELENSRVLHIWLFAWVLSFERLYGES